MFTVTQVANALGISNTLLRQRGAEYADYLSDYANPGKGETRRYTEDDIAVLQTVAVLKAQNKSEDDILAALDAGERYEPSEMPGAKQTASGKDDKALVTSEFAAALQSYETQLTNLQQKNDDLHERLLAAEIRATIAETKLEAVSILGDDETAAGGDVVSGEGQEAAPVKLTRRQRLAKWIAGE